MASHSLASPTWIWILRHNDNDRLRYLQNSSPKSYLNLFERHLPWILVHIFSYSGNDIHGFLFPFRAYSKDLTTDSTDQVQVVSCYRIHLSCGSIYALLGLTNQAAMYFSFTSCPCRNIDETPFIVTSTAYCYKAGLTLSLFIWEKQQRSFPILSSVLKEILPFRLLNIFSALLKSFVHIVRLPYPPIFGYQFEFIGLNLLKLSFIWIL